MWGCTASAGVGYNDMRLIYASLTDSVHSIQVLLPLISMLRCVRVDGLKRVHRSVRCIIVTNLSRRDVLCSAA
jgi:hypothetical protein